MARDAVANSIFILLLTAVISISGNIVGVKIIDYFECPLENGIFPHPSDCNAYYSCKNGAQLLGKCPEGLFYNSETTLCDFADHVKCNNKGEGRIKASPKFNCTANGAFPHETACELYYTCWEGQDVLHSCAELMLFDLRYDGCNFADLTDCGDRIRPPDYPGTVTPPTPRPSTTTADPNVTTTTGEPDEGYNCTTNGAFPHRIYCEKYYDCYDGVDTLYVCGGDMLFDLRWAGCNFPEDTACQDRLRPPGAPGTRTPPADLTTSTTRRPGSFECPNGEDGLHPDPENCRGFYQCSNWQAYHYTCPFPLLYNPAIFACDHPGSVDCGDRPSP